MRDLTMITDDLTGAADSGGYFIERGASLTIYTEWQGDVCRNGDEIVAINLSSRNIGGKIAKLRHYNACQQVETLGEQSFFKKIGTGFRGNDAYELEGLLEGMPDYVCFVVDNAPDLGTFTLYGNQYCEGQILHKSLYASDPVMPPTKSYIPEILAEHTALSVGIVDIDAVKGGRIAEAVQALLAEGRCIIVFDAITRADTLAILGTLYKAYPKVFWTGSLGIAEGLATMLYGEAHPHHFAIRPIRSICFSASAYEMTKKQIAYSQENGLQVVALEIDAMIEGDTQVRQRAVDACLAANQIGNVILVPRVERYSGQAGISGKILAEMEHCARIICQQANFDRIVVIGGETAQTIFRAHTVGRLQLLGKPEPGLAEGVILDGLLAGKEFALKGGSIGSVEALEKMLCRWLPKEDG